MATADGEQPGENTPLLGDHQHHQYSIYGRYSKLIIVIAATLASTFSPLSANIYYPALTGIKDELQVSDSLLNLTISSYMIFQGLSPTFIGSLSDKIGRRPVYMFCFSTYIAVNICLTLTHSYTSLLLLRCLQSAGISSTVSLAYAVTADIVTASERGSYIGFASIGPIIGPSVGPLVGGLISQYYGWRSIFTFLAVVSGSFFVLLLLFFPETCRRIVGDGSIPPSSLWHRTVFSRRFDRRISKNATTSTGNVGETDTKPKKGSGNPAHTLHLLFHVPMGLVLFYNGILFAGYYAVVSSLTFSFREIYQFNDVHIGLAYLPIGIGTMMSAIFNGILVDWNYRRHAARIGMSIPSKARRISVEQGGIRFPIEIARLQIAIPMALIGALFLVVYGWTMQFAVPPIVPLVLLFIFGYAGTAAYNIMNVLIVDLNTDAPASATAANNLVRCFLGAGATAVVVPTINMVDVGWTFTIISAIWVVLSPLMILILYRANRPAETGATVES